MSFQILDSISIVKKILFYYPSNEEVLFINSQSLSFAGKVNFTEKLQKKLNFCLKCKYENTAEEPKFKKHIHVHKFKTLDSS